ncbi:MAG TPA: hypothetical protein ENK18_01465 [Deltaproteobacteria bacterium]|nr:hypothetical protein [Deltaproteobacteria bacterium]
MEQGPCLRHAPRPRSGLDTELPLGALPGLCRALAAELVSVVVELPGPEGWCAATVHHPLHALELIDEPPASAWIVQRPGCGGLITRLVLLDRHGELVASIVPRGAPGEPEPIAWRVQLLVSIVGSRAA